jgi:hypothetical protein
MRAGTWTLFRGAALLSALTAPAAAAGLDAPKGSVVLTVTGAIAHTNGPDGARFDMDQLERLPQHSFTTSTIWTDGAHTYTGVLLQDLLVLVGAQGREIEAIALNDYSARLTATDITEEAPLLAYHVNGKQMTVRDKGPIWLIYPFDDNPAYRTEHNYTRAVWQLIRLVVQE